MDKVVNFKDFSRPNKESSTLQGPKPNSRTFKTTTKIQVNSNSSSYAAQGFQYLSLKFKTFSRLYEPWFCDANRDSVDDKKKCNLLLKSNSGKQLYWSLVFATSV